MTLHSPENETTVVTDITENDVIEFRSYHLSHSRVVRRQTRITVSIILLAWCAALAVMVFSSEKPLQAAKDMWPLLCGPPLFLAIFFPLKNRRMRRLSRKLLREGQNRAMLGKMKVTLSAQGVRELGEVNDTFVKWQGVEKVVASPSAIYIYISTASAVIVPRRAFPGEEDFLQFCALARNYLPNPKANP
jgi:hypothetical protein